MQRFDRVLVECLGLVEPILVTEVFSDPQDDEPLGLLANFIDIRLEFSCGLIAALVALRPELIERLMKPPMVEKGRELPNLPPGIESL